MDFELERLNCLKTKFVVIWLCLKSSSVYCDGGGTPLTEQASGMFSPNVLWGNSLRTYATLKDIQLRLKSIKNIGKITKSMKMIASTKLNRAQRAMESGRTFGKTSAGFLEHIEIAKTSEDDSNKAKKPNSPSNLLIACSSDRGLCGAIHSSVSKYVKKLVAERPSDATMDIVVLGDKSKPQIARTCRRNILMSFNQIGKDIPTFTDASAIAQIILSHENNYNYDRVSVIHNTFLSPIAYESVPLTVYPVASLQQAPRLSAYEYDDSVLEAYSQFLLASRIFHGLVEGHASEMSAKRMAMENASKNSDEIVLALTMQYNRTRQATITNELVDIITGASAL